jgi:hypothetical protein
LDENIRKIVENYIKNDYYQMLNENAIIDRWNWFLDIFKKLFEIDLSGYKK